MLPTSANEIMTKMEASRRTKEHYFIIGWRSTSLNIDMNKLENGQDNWTSRLSPNLVRVTVKLNPQATERATQNVHDKKEGKDVLNWDKQDTKTKFSNIE